MVPCLEVLLHNVAAKKVTDVFLVLKDSDMESENLSLLIQFSVSDSQKKNRQFKRCITYRYIINHGMFCDTCNIIIYLFHRDGLGPV